MTWLITGGAGYIGSHIMRAFAESGIDVVAYDSLITGHREFVAADVELIEGDVRDYEALNRAFKNHAISGVVHLAGFKYANVSVEQPLVAYDHNVNGTLALLLAMQNNNVDAIVYSSSAAVYGTPKEERVTESSPTNPESPYGESKLIGEWAIAAQARATGLRHTSLRYFNVVGSGFEDLYDSSPHSLFSKVLTALQAGEAPQIFGDDYPTPDGTCVRDYVHVSDLAHSHVEAAKALEAGRSLEPIYNLGSGDGKTVREMVDTLLAATGSETKAEVAGRRPGDPARIVANGDLAKRDLDWEMRHSTAQMASSAWNAHKKLAL